jgi:hypothetical protein
MAIPSRRALSNAKWADPPRRPPVNQDIDTTRLASGGWKFLEKDILEFADAAAAV